jgi:hypothetical protein
VQAPAVWVKVTLASVNPATVRSATYWLTDMGQAMHPTQLPRSAGCAGVRVSSATTSLIPSRPPGRSTRNFSANTAGLSTDRLIT